MNGSEFERVPRATLVGEVCVNRAPGALLRLVHSLERRRGRSFSLTVVVTTRTGAPMRAELTGVGPRAFVVGTGDRADVPLPITARALDDPQPRQFVVVCTPRADGALVRVLSLQPERGISVLDDDSADPGFGDRGGVLARHGVRVGFDGAVLEVQARLDDDVQHLPEVLEVHGAGEQLAFFDGPAVRAVGDALSSVCGPGSGGHAIPALVAVRRHDEHHAGTLVLRARHGVQRLDVTPDELRRGLLVGRSRRCTLGRGFDENDGLSRMHALVVELDDGVYALDLASRYGLRDVARPSQLLPTARLDDGVGCMVDGAGDLSSESTGR